MIMLLLVLISFLTSQKSVNIKLSSRSRDIICVRVFWKQNCFTDTTNVGTTTVGTRYRTFIEDGGNVAWLVAALLVFVVICAYFAWLAYTCRGQNGFTAFGRMMWGDLGVVWIIHNYTLHKYDHHICLKGIINNEIIIIKGPETLGRSTESPRPSYLAKHNNLAMFIKVITVLLKLYILHA